MRALLALIVIAFVVCGCHPASWRDSVVTAAATSHRCIRNHIQILRDDGNDAGRTVLLDVCGTPRTYRSTTRDPRAAWSQQGWVEVINEEDVDVTHRVRREATSDGHAFRLRAESVVDGTAVRWLAIPARDADHVAITVVAPEPLPSATCEVRAMVDGVIVQLPRSGAPTGEAADRTAFASAPLAFVRQLAGSQRAAMRICTTEVQIGSEERALLVELIARFDEELRWIDHAAIAQ